MKILVIIFALVLSSHYLLSQNLDKIKINDSLQNELSQAASDTTRLNILSKLASNGLRIDLKMAQNYAKEGLVLARKISNTKQEANFLQIIGESYWRDSDYNNAINYLYQSLSLASKIGANGHLCDANIYLSATFRDYNDYEKALEYAYDALNVAKKMKENNKICFASLQIGTVYSRMNKLDSAKYYLQISYNNFKWAYTALEMGHLFFKLHQYNEALAYYRECEHHPSNWIKDLCYTYLSIAKVFKVRLQNDSCLIYAQKAIDLGTTINHYSSVIEAGNLLAELYQNTNLKEAYKFHLLATAAKDSLYSTDKLRQSESLKYGEQIRLQEIESTKTKIQNQIKLYSSLIGLAIVLFVSFFLYRNNQQKQKANYLLNQQKEEINQKSIQLEKSLETLKSTQNQLIQKEKLASLGELTAGIAHEIQNPLNFVNNFSELSVDLVKDLKDEMDKSPLTPDGGTMISAKDKAYIEELFDDLSQNQEKINHHGKRASSIVKGMLEHSRTSSGERALTDINALADEYLRLSYHGMRAKDKTFNADYQTEFDENLSKIEVIPQDIGRVLLNLFNNAFYAVQERNLRGFENLEGLNTYTPSVIVSTQRADNQIILSVKDNGSGIPENIKAKIFQPFFTTKPTGQGTGLGLSLAYDIVTKGHGGTLEVVSTVHEGNPDEMEKSVGTEFIIYIPFKTK